MARRRSKSLPELDSAADGDESETHKRPASVEGSNEESSNKDTSSKFHTASTGVQRGRLSSTPSILGTIPLSHAPSATPLTCSVSSTTPFAIPRTNYPTVPNPAGSYSGFASYQSYGMAAAGMPTQSAYPTTYNPYSCTTGSAAYVGNSASPGSTLYHQNTRFSPPSYASNPNMMSYMYPSSDCRQASAMPYTCPTLAYNSSPALSTPSTSMYSSNGSDMLTSSAVTSQDTPNTVMSNGDGASMGTNNGGSPNNNNNNITNNVKAASSSPSVPDSSEDCDSTTHRSTMAPPMKQEAERESAQEDKPADDVSVIRYYTTRYACSQTRHVMHVWQLVALSSFIVDSQYAQRELT